MTSPASRVLDVDKEDGEERSPLAGLFPTTLPVKSLVESLAQPAQRFPKLQADGVLIKKALRKARQMDEAQFPGMNVDARAAIVLYTMEDQPREHSPYFAMNEALRDKNRQAVEPWRDYIWLLLHALKKLPASPLRQVVRGCKRAISTFGLQVTPGKEITWSSFSSTATTIDVMQTFLGESGPRVLFQIELTEPLVARDVRAFSLFEGENELLLPPNMSFEVKSVWHAGNDLHIVQYTQVESLDEILDLTPAVALGAAMASEEDQLAWALQESTKLAAQSASSSNGQVANGELSEIASLVAQLMSGTDMQKEQAAGALQNLALNADNKVAIAQAGGIAPLVALAKSGTDAQKENAAGALRNLALNADNKVAIAQAGGIAPLVALAKSGTDAQKEKAAGALRSLSVNADNKVAVAQAGGIAPLVALAKSGTDAQKEHAAGALWNLSVNADNQVAVAQAGGIAPLVALAKSGTDAQKEHAAVALRNLAINADNKVAIAQAGGIAPLVALAKSGTDAQKEHAAVALRNLAVNADNKVAIAQAGGIAPLVALAKSGTDKQKEYAAGALRNLSANADNKAAIAQAGYQI